MSREYVFLLHEVLNLGNHNISSQNFCYRFRKKRNIAILILSTILCFIMYFCGEEEEDGKDAILCWSWECPWWQLSCSNFLPCGCLPSFLHHPAPRIHVYQRRILCILSRGDPQTSSGTSSLKQILVEMLFCPKFIKNNKEEKIDPMSKGKMVKAVSVFFIDFWRIKTTYKCIDFSQNSTKCYHTERNTYFSGWICFDSTPKWLVLFSCVWEFLTTSWDWSQS